jgi:hypothetical protein
MLWFKSEHYNYISLICVCMYSVIIGGITIKPAFMFMIRPFENIIALKKLTEIPSVASCELGL